MRTVSEIKKQLRWGDMKTVAEISGYSYVYVKKVFNEERRNEKIVNVARKLIEKRNEITPEGN